MENKKFTPIKNSVLIMKLESYMLYKSFHLYFVLFFLKGFFYGTHNIFKIFLPYSAVL